MQTWVVPEKLSDDARAVWFSAIPQEHDVSTKMTQEMTKELDDLRSPDVLVGMKSTIQSKTPPLGRDRQGRDGRDLGPVASRYQNRRMASGSPCTRNGGNQQEPAFIEEAQVGSKFCGFFLCEATPAASNSEWPSRFAPGLVWWASDTSSPWFSSVSRHSESCTVSQIHDRSALRSGVMSTDWSHSQLPSDLAEEASITVHVGVHRAEVFGLEKALHVNRSSPRYGTIVATVRPNSVMPRQSKQRRDTTHRLSEAGSPGDDAAPGSGYCLVVSWPQDTTFPNEYPFNN